MILLQRYWFFVSINICNALQQKCGKNLTSQRPQFGGTPIRSTQFKMRMKPGKVLFASL
jgi:hypothetical protein